MATPVGIERAKQAPALNHLPDTPKTALRPFLVAEEHGVVFVGGIVHGHNQVPILARHPLMLAAILMHKHARPGSTLASFAGAHRAWAPS